MGEIRKIADEITKGSNVTIHALRSLAESLGGSAVRVDQLNGWPNGGTYVNGYLMMLIAAKLEDCDMLK